MEYKAFKDLTKEERSEIVEAMLRGEAEWLNRNGDWAGEANFVFVNTIYRVKPAEKLDIPWEIIKPEYKWAAMDEDGVVMVFNMKPATREGNYWTLERHSGACTDTLMALSIDTTGISWENSLTQRPE